MRRMKVYLTDEQWAELRVQQYPQFVRSAFYLSLPYAYIALNVRSVVAETERTKVVQLAQEMGITDADVVLKYTPERRARDNP